VLGAGSEVLRGLLKARRNASIDAVIGSTMNGTKMLTAR
jgi:hypothetical protein